MKTLVMLSGGIGALTLLRDLTDRKRNVITCTFDGNVQDVVAAEAAAGFFGVPWKLLTERMYSCNVELQRYAIASAIALEQGCSTIAIGTMGGPDGVSANLGFLYAMRDVLESAPEGDALTLEAPYKEMSRAGIIDHARIIRLDLSYAYTS